MLDVVIVPVIHRSRRCGATPFTKRQTLESALQGMSGMPDQPKRQEPPKPRANAPRPKEDRESAEEVLREQAKTEIEERPYLDTEGGE
jgi:hypothetical protein